MWEVQDLFQLARSDGKGSHWLQTGRDQSCSSLQRDDTARYRWQHSLIPSCCTAGSTSHSHCQIPHWYHFCQGCSRKPVRYKDLRKLL